jgi:hypothetical protein
MHLLQDPKLVGNGALRKLDGFRNITDAPLLLRQKGQNLHSGGITEGLEKLRDAFCNFFFQCDPSCLFPYFSAKPPERQPFFPKSRCHRQITVLY